MTWRRVLVCLPSNDPKFEEVVDSLARLSDRPEALQDELRRGYPSAVVRPSVLTGEPQRWYVYRDGAFTSGPAVPPAHRRRRRTPRPSPARRPAHVPSGQPRRGRAHPRRQD